MTLHRVFFISTKKHHQTQIIKVIVTVNIIAVCSCYLKEGHHVKKVFSFLLASASLNDGHQWCRQFTQITSLGPGRSRVTSMDFRSSSRSRSPTIEGNFPENMTL